MGLVATKLMKAEDRVPILGVQARLAVLVVAACLAVFAAPESTAAPLVVNNVADSGPGSLRQAILDANAASGLDTILFQFPETGVHTIAPNNALPTIASPVVIDATTLPDYAGTPLIELNGSNAGPLSDGLYLTAGNSTIRGLAINRFGGAGIKLEITGGNVIQGNFIGTDPTGTLSRGNGSGGNRRGGLWVKSSGNLIGGPYATNRNVMSANVGAGLYLQDCSSNTVQGNYIGTSVSGAAALGNTINGIDTSSTVGNQIGGSSAGLRNIISGNGGSGVYLATGSTGNQVQGNYIGTDATGSLAIPNTGDGVTALSVGGNTIGGTDAGAGNLISGNGQGGVALKGAGSDNNLFQGNFIGTSASGLVALGNTLSGITISGGNSNWIGGAATSARNVISANKLAGILISTNSVGNLVQGNLIGLDVTGSIALGNATNGITIASASSNTIGGTATGARNVISGNGKDGILIFGAGATSNLVQGNYVGTSASGTSAVGNARAGILFSDDAPGNTIGGAQPGEGNLLSGNKKYGIFLLGSGTTGNVIQGNKIGTDMTGTAGVWNEVGIWVQRASTNIIGGSTPGAGNVISANLNWGVILTNNASWNVLQGNSIGTAIDGVSALGNGYQGNSSGFHAIDLYSACHDNIIGGTTPGAGNRIAFAPYLFNIYYAGVRLRDGATNNLISGNAIFANAGLGIDLSAYLVTANDNCDGDGGANMQQNYPVLTQAVSGASTIIRGTLNSRPNQAFVLQFFANSTCDSFGYGEGQTYLGQTNVVTGIDCNASFVANLPVQVPSGHVITATATDNANNTSEFSSCVSVTPAPLSIITDPQSHAACTGQNASFSVTADGYMPSYQWWFNDSPVAGATADTLSLTNLQETNAGNYWVVITNAGGSTNSAVATLKVSLSPVITQQPQSRAAVLGSTAQFSVGASSNTNLTYQWQHEATNLVSQTNAVLPLPNVQASDFGSYRVIVNTPDCSTASLLARLTQAVQPSLALSRISLGTGYLTFSTEFGPMYALEYKNALKDPVWLEITNVNGTGSPVTVAENNLTNSTRFYRIQVR